MANRLFLYHYKPLAKKTTLKECNCFAVGCEYTYVGADGFAKCGKVGYCRSKGHTATPMNTEPYEPQDDNDVEINLHDFQDRLNKIM